DAERSEAVGGGNPAVVVHLRQEGSAGVDDRDFRPCLQKGLGGGRGGPASLTIEERDPFAGKGVAQVTRRRLNRAPTLKLERLGPRAGGKDDGVRCERQHVRFAYRGIELDFD